MRRGGSTTGAYVVRAQDGSREAAYGPGQNQLARTRAGWLPGARVFWEKHGLTNTADEIIDRITGRSRSMDRTQREVAVAAIVQQEVDVTEATDPDRSYEPGAMQHLSAAAGTIAEIADLIEAEGWDAETADRCVRLVADTLRLVGAAQTDLVEQSMGI